MSKVILLSTRYDLGGASLLATEIAAQLRNRGHDAEAWCLYLHSERHAPPDPWVRIILHHEPRGVRDLMTMLTGLLSAMREFRPDAFFGVQPLANILGAVAAAAVGCSRRYGGQHNPANSQRYILRALERFVGTFIYTGNIAVSESVRQTYLGYPALYRNKMTLIHNGIPERGRKYSKSEAREHFGLPCDYFLIGTVGQHDTDQKHHDFLIDLLPRIPDVHLAIAGDGRLRGQLEERIAVLNIADRVHLLGSVPRKSIEAFLDTLDVFLLPSRFEGFSLSLLEAMQSELPIIGNDIDMIREALCDANEHYGLLIPTGRPDEWSQNILELKNDPRSCVMWSKRAAEGLKRFSLEKMINAYEQAAVGDSEADGYHDLLLAPDTSSADHRQLPNATGSVA
ncbi:MAG: glycosyltransferase family 4 protein [Rhodopila sp.]|jgi:glycosyltransferase involved in cell wall biosynthesis